MCIYSKYLVGQQYEGYVILRHIVEPVNKNNNSIIIPAPPI